MYKYIERIEGLRSNRENIKIKHSNRQFSLRIDDMI